MSCPSTRSAPASSVSLDLGQLSYARSRADADPHQSPIRIKAFVLYAQCLKHGPCPPRSHGPRKSSVPCRVQLDVLQILWFLANPFVAHDIGEPGRKMTTAQNSVDYVGAAATNHISWINTNPIAGSLLHQKQLIKKSACIIGHLVTHNVIGCPAYFVAQSLDGNYPITLSLFALVESLGLWTESDSKVCRFYIGP